MLRSIRMLALSAVFILAACTQEKTASAAAPEVSQAPIPATQAPSMAAARKFARGFETGNLNSQQHVYVFFDPQCPHCGMFWNETKKLAKDAHFTWVPVAILNRTSMSQGAALLSAKSPVEAMDAHEAKLLARTSGMTAGIAEPQFKTIIERNTQVLESFGARGVPFVLGVNEQTGAVFAESRGMPAELLVKELGWKVTDSVK